MDPLETYYQENKPELDRLDPSPGLWDKLDAELEHKSQQKQLFSWWKKGTAVAAGLTLMIGLGFLFQNIQNHSSENTSSIQLNEISPDIILATPEGAPVALSSLQGKVVLIEFWASWCNVCTEKNCGELLPIYDEYSKKGFEIYAVSLDKDPYMWQESLEQNKYPWIQVSDLQGFASPVSQQFGVKETYTTFLLDSNQKVIGKNLSRAQLERQLRACYGEEI